MNRIFHGKHSVTHGQDGHRTCTKKGEKFLYTSNYGGNFKRVQKS